MEGFYPTLGARGDNKGMVPVLGNATEHDFELRLMEKNFNVQGHHLFSSHSGMWLLLAGVIELLQRGKKHAVCTDHQAY